MADRDIETVVDGMETMSVSRHVTNWLAQMQADLAPLSCGCDGDHQCPEHEIRPEPER
jgi:hypothetical protein